MVQILSCSLFYTHTHSHPHTLTQREIESQRSIFEYTCFLDESFLYPWERERPGPGHSASERVEQLMGEWKARILHLHRSDILIQPPRSMKYKPVSEEDAVSVAPWESSTPVQRQQVLAGFLPPTTHHSLIHGKKSQGMELKGTALKTIPGGYSPGIFLLF